MKVLIVSIGILLMFTEFMVFQSDMNRYVRTRDYIAQIAWDCVDGMNDQFLRDSANEEGRLFDETLMNEELALLAERLNTQLKNRLTESVDIELELIDEDNKGLKSRITGRIVGHPAVIIRIYAKTKDFFRLPVLSVTQIEKTIVLQLV